MRALAMLVVSAVVLGAGPQDKEKDDKEKLQGTWKVTSCKINGDNLYDLSKTSVKWTIKEDQRTTNQDGKAYPPGRFAIDPKADPKTFDMLDDDGKVRYRGIYKFEGPRLVICYNSKKRPTRFDSKEAAKEPFNVLYEFERK